jgi:hypothetical protein
VDAVREFEVVKDTYGAEYGKRPGAQINIVTASGSNQLHGNSYEFLRNSALDARNFFDQAKIPNFQRNVFGGSLGAPIKKDKAFLFGNYEGFRQVLGLSDVTLVPDDASRAAAVASVQPYLNLWPVASPGTELFNSNGKPSGIAKAFTNPQQHIREDFGTARFDQIFSDKDTFAGVYTVDQRIPFADEQSIQPGRRFLARASGQSQRNSPLLFQHSHKATFDCAGILFPAESPTRWRYRRLASCGATGRHHRDWRRHHSQRRIATHQRRHERRKQSHGGAQSLYRDG